MWPFGRDAEVEKLRAEVAALRKLLTKHPTVDEFDRRLAERVAAEEAIRKRLAEHSRGLQASNEVDIYMAKRLDAIEAHIKQCVGQDTCDWKSELRELLDACDTNLPTDR